MTDVVYGTDSGDATLGVQLHLGGGDTQALTTDLSTFDAPQAVRSSPGWVRRYTTVLVIEDALCALAAIAIGWAVRFGCRKTTSLTPTRP